MWLELKNWKLTKPGIESLPRANLKYVHCKNIKLAKTRRRKKLQEENAAKSRKTG